MGPTRSRRGSAYPSLFVLFTFAILTLALASSCSDDPAGTFRKAVDPTGQGDIDPDGPADFLIGSVSIDGTPDGLLDVWAHDLTVDARNGVVFFDVVLTNRSGRVIFPPLVFLITDLTPSHVEVLNPDLIRIGERVVGFDFSDDLGDDGRLDPGESTAPVNMQFVMQELTSFSIGFRIEVGPPPGDILISGVVFRDDNRDGERNANEPGIPNIRVVLTGTFGGSDPFEIIRSAVTNERGRYGFRDLRAGVYKLTAMVPAHWAPTTPNPLLVTLIADSGGNIKPFNNADFGFFVADPPEKEPLFGPMPVGPGTFIGSLFEGSFMVQDPDNSNSRYILKVDIPPILSPELMWVDTVHVAINRVPIYNFACEDPDSLVCLPHATVQIPPRVIVDGSNHIRIFVNGSDRSFLFFTVARDDIVVTN